MASSLVGAHSPDRTLNVPIVRYEGHPEDTELPPLLLIDNSVPLSLLHSGLAANTVQ